ncbi:MAG: hypothetical protein M1828_005092 [Chrysothrix sp. TS-e1954]|nr:MAG: hypothetical protein M1828_005092 [Chrysothrix sp. TS-e1954]
MIPPVDFTGMFSPAVLKAKLQRSSSTRSNKTKTETAPTDTSSPHPEPSTNAPTSNLSRVFRGLYPPGTPLSLTHLSPYETYPTETEFRQRTINFMRSIPHDVLNPVFRPLARLPQSTLTNWASLFGGSESVLPAAYLCPVHSRLNGQVVSSAVAYVEHEIEDHLVDSIAAIGGLDNLRPEARYLLRAAEDIMALRILEAEFCYFYKRPPPQRYVKAYSRCQACALTVIGSERDVLIALRALLLSRLPDEMRNGSKQSIWSVWIEHWMSAYARGHSLNHKALLDMMMQRSEMVEKELRGLRDGDDITVCWSPGSTAWPETPASALQFPSPISPFAPEFPGTSTPPRPTRRTSLPPTLTLPTLEEESEAQACGGADLMDSPGSASSLMPSSATPWSPVDGSAHGLGLLPSTVYAKPVASPQRSVQRSSSSAHSRGVRPMDPSSYMASTSPATSPGAAEQSSKRQGNSSATSRQSKLLGPSNPPSIDEIVNSARSAGWPTGSPIAMTGADWSATKATTQKVEANANAIRPKQSPPNLKRSLSSPARSSGHVSNKFSQESLVPQGLSWLRPAYDNESKFDDHADEDDADHRGSTFNDSHAAMAQTAQAAVNAFRAPSMIYSPSVYSSRYPSRVPSMYNAAAGSHANMNQARPPRSLFGPHQPPFSGPGPPPSVCSSCDQRYSSRTTSANDETGSNISSSYSSIAPDNLMTDDSTAPTSPAISSRYPSYVPDTPLANPSQIYSPSIYSPRSFSNTNTSTFNARQRSLLSTPKQSYPSPSSPPPAPSRPSRPPPPPTGTTPTTPTPNQRKPLTLPYDLAHADQPMRIHPLNVNSVRMGIRVRRVGGWWI